MKLTLLLALFFSASVFAVESDNVENHSSTLLRTTPLLPNNQERKKGPIYSQDKFKQIDETDTIDLPKYSQDKFGKKEKKKDYSSELRKSLEKGREKGESHLGRGILAFEENRLNESVKELNLAIQEDPKNFLAYEYLGQTQESLQNFPLSIESYVKAKHIAPENRFGSINYQIGRIYFNQKNYERAKIYLELARKQSGHLVATNYLLGYLKYLEKNYLQAEPYFRQARILALHFLATESEKKLLQPIHYYLGEIYARLGYFDYSVAMLGQTEFGESPELRNAAWRVHSEINESSAGFGGAVAGIYDNNVILLPQTGNLPTEFSAQSALGTLIQGFGYYQTSPARALRLFTEGQIQMNNYMTSNLEKYDALMLTAALQGDLWDQKEWLGRLRFDIFNASTDRKKFERFQTKYGPTLSLRYFPYSRWNYELGSSLQFASFAKDLENSPDRRSGYDLAFFFKAFVDAPNPQFKPRLQYSYILTATDGENFRARTHFFEAALLWTPGFSFSLTPSAGFKIIDFPDHLFGRHDTYSQFKLLGTYGLNERWVLFGDTTLISSGSSLNSFKYNRFIMSTGISFQY